MILAFHFQSKALEIGTRKQRKFTLSCAVTSLSRFRIFQSATWNCFSGKDNLANIRKLIPAKQVVVVCHRQFSQATAIQQFRTYFIFGNFVLHSCTKRKHKASQVSIHNTPEPFVQLFHSFWVSFCCFSPCNWRVCCHCSTFRNLLLSFLKQA